MNAHAGSIPRERPGAPDELGVGRADTPPQRAHQSGAAMTRTRPASSHAPATVVVLVALASSAAGIIHFLVAPEHLAEIPWLGRAFLVTGWLQVMFGWACLLRAPGRRGAVLVAGMNAAFIGVWVWSRAIGWPIEAPGEPIHAIDLTCVAFEGATAALLLWIAARPLTSLAWRRDGVGIAAALLAAVVVSVALLLTPADTNGMNGGAFDRAEPGAGSARMVRSVGRDAAGTLDVVARAETATSSHHP